MGWAVGFDERWNRDVGYGVPSVCDEPTCAASIDRGLSYVCGGEPFGGDKGCGLYFCEAHLWYSAITEPRLCTRCLAGESPYEPKADVRTWIEHKLQDESWATWRVANPANAEKLRAFADAS